MLYIEDDDAAEFLMQSALDEARIQVQMFRVRNGEEALEWLKRSGAFADAPRPDLILLDINLPRKGGLEVLAEIHGDMHLRPIPVVILSSSYLEADRRRAVELGVRNYIRKPLTFPAFVDAVRSACALLPQ